MSKLYSSKSNARRAALNAGLNAATMVHVVVDGKHCFNAGPVAKIVNNGKANTKARQARAIIAEEYKVSEGNSGAVIARLMAEFNFGKTLATTYFNNNLAKMQS